MQYKKNLYISALILLACLSILLAVYSKPAYGQGADQAQMERRLAALEKRMGELVSSLYRPGAFSTHYHDGVDRLDEGLGKALARIDAMQKSINDQARQINDLQNASSRKNHDQAGFNNDLNQISRQARALEADNNELKRQVRENERKIRDLESEVRNLKSRLR